MISISLLDTIPLWAFATWLALGPVAAVIGFRRWCCYFKRNFGYFRGTDIKDAVLITVFSLIAGPLMLLFIGLDIVNDYYDKHISDKKFFEGRKWK